MAITKATQDVIEGITATGSTTARTLANRFADVVNVKDFGAVGDGSPSDQSSIQSALSYAISNNKIIGFDFNATIRIPTDAPTISDAINHVEILNKNVEITINIETGYVITNQVLLNNINAGQFKITSTDIEVQISRQDLTIAVDGIYYPAFYATGSLGVLPKINALFNMDSTGVAAGRNGIFVNNGAYVYVAPSCGVKNAGGRGLHVANYSTAIARQSNFSGAGEAAVRCAAAYCEVRQSNLSNSSKGLMLASSALIDADASNISGCVIGVESFNAIVRLSSSNISGCTNAILSYDNSILSADFSNIDNATNNAVSITRGSRINLRSSSILNAGGIAISATNCSNVSAANVNASNAGTYAIYANGSIIDANNANLTNSGIYGVFAESGSFINVNIADATGSGTHGYFNNFGSFINATNAIGSRGRTQNVVTRHGIIFSDGSVPWSFGPSEITPETNNTHDIGSLLLMLRRLYVREIRTGVSGDIRILSASGSPEGIISAPVGSIYLRQDGGSGTALYVKESGTGNTGWSSK